MRSFIYKDPIHWICHSRNVIKSSMSDILLSLDMPSQSISGPRDRQEPDQGVIYIYTHTSHQLTRISENQTFHPCHRPGRCIGCICGGGMGWPIGPAGPYMCCCCLFASLISAEPPEISDIPLLCCCGACICGGGGGRCGCAPYIGAGCMPGWMA